MGGDPCGRMHLVGDVGAALALAPAPTSGWQHTANPETSGAKFPRWFQDPAAFTGTNPKDRPATSGLQSNRIMPSQGTK